MKAKIILPILFVAVFALSRIPDPYLPGFSAAYALAFCAGVYLRGAMAWWLPLVVMVVTDVALSVFKYHLNPFQPELLVNYAVYAGLIGMGKWFTKRAGFWKLVLGGTVGALAFYLITNTMAWLMDPHYTRTLAGWVQALFTGLPGWPSSWEFFRNTLLSGALFTALFAGAAKAAEESPAEKTAGVAEAENEEPASEAVKG
ncbi:MAG TPA: DUF6580 family putative transport protein [Pseudomonadales bacterium]|nr:DUF6580 family putative transport protein [Pseudomonadales bacterium]